MSLLFLYRQLNDTDMFIGWPRGNKTTLLHSTFKPYAALDRGSFEGVPIIESW